jgi:hypothetical protein
MTGIDRKFSWLAALLLVLVSACGAGGQEADMSYGVPVYPDAESMPEIAAAVEAFYRPGVPHDQRIETAVFETSAEFEEVYRFYGPRMEPGKWGWRRKSYGLEHQTQTLRFMRANMTNGNQPLEAGPTDDAVDPARLEPLEPLFGEAELSPAEFDALLVQLNEKYPGATIEVAEGSRPIESIEGGQVRITIERPYLDLRRMELVDRTRIILVKVSQRG